MVKYVCKCWLCDSQYRKEQFLKRKEKQAIKEYKLEAKEITND